ncbi:hypothetical protein [Tropicimonas sp.]|uniref:hypothetical protein n=1 Tax=Tropicimonas sp. TaxID=2067044 RepID=UPI003A87ADCB
MKITKGLTVAAGLFAVACTAAFADGGPSVALDKAALPGAPVWGDGGATLTPLAIGDAGAPAVVLVRVPANTPAHDAHATSDGQDRLAFVLSGTLYYADGDVVDPAAEAAFGPGSVLVIHSGTSHWVSTRDEALELLLVASPPERLAPPVSAQLAK